MSPVTITKIMDDVIPPEVQTQACSKVLRLACSDCEKVAAQWSLDHMSDKRLTLCVTIE